MSVLSDVQLAAIMLEAGFPANPKVIAEGIGVIHAESGGDPKSKVPGNEHIGLWAESPTFGTEAQRLNALESTRAAFREWKKDGGFFQAWGRWEAEQSGRNGALNFRQYLGAAMQAIARFGKAGTPRASSSPAGGKTPATSPSSGSTGVSGPMRFLLTAALVLGGFALIGLGAMRAVGQKRTAVA